MKRLTLITLALFVSASSQTASKAPAENKTTAEKAALAVRTAASYVGRSASFCAGLISGGIVSIGVVPAIATSFVMRDPEIKEAYYEASAQFVDTLFEDNQTALNGANCGLIGGYISMASAVVIGCYKAYLAYRS